MFKHGASYLQGGDFRFHCYSIPNSINERLGYLFGNFAAGVGGRYVAGRLAGDGRGRLFVKVGDGFNLVAFVESTKRDEKYGGESGAR